jgi:hypothetical protein
MDKVELSKEVGIARFPGKTVPRSGPVPSLAPTHPCVLILNWDSDAQDFYLDKSTQAWSAWEDGIIARGDSTTPGNAKALGLPTRLEALEKEIQEVKCKGGIQ